MTDIQTAPKTGSGADVAAGVAQYFTPVLHELVALAVNGKQAHWHVRGVNFIAVHELLDDVVAHAQEWADEVAERVVALGLPIDGRLATIASKSGAVNPKLGFQGYEDTIADVVAQIDIATEKLNEAIEGLDELDPASQDVAIEIRRGIDKDRWFLAAHVAKK
ncbi:DNA starvation/stationary phase protection protein [Agromyces intestinalis]|uniref:DNA starvation/stationary phase protection protein n=1 Tax=Agromyces intestinalis TaxID=2592652 RepID=A0A5C1YJN5_9MICO|nr:DNA starvation/stationary phase protection protein [Agromyces intestinalis]QEO15808.1 DNA starvation/stationary phase protection protein [Agromyces intestinalis]